MMYRWLEEGPVELSDSLRLPVEPCTAAYSVSYLGCLFSGPAPGPFSVLRMGCLPARHGPVGSAAPRGAPRSPWKGRTGAAGAATRPAVPRLSRGSTFRTSRWGMEGHGSNSEIPRTLQRLTGVRGCPPRASAA